MCPVWLPIFVGFCYYVDIHWALTSARTRVDYYTVLLRPKRLQKGVQAYLLKSRKESIRGT
ncbi:hypothetical protein AGR1B_Lc10008 [Agrobacterium fabacearum S56]|nr:hypothetical protein AGR1B_Lc10008 [Agrobacterium fabacearum S56]